jgi:hypothetical protein
MFASRAGHDVRDVFPGASMVRPALSTSARTNRNWLQFTRYDEYNIGIEPPATGSLDAFVVDNGISAYAIVPWNGRMYWVDPHTGPNPRPVLLQKQLDTCRDGWMMLQVRVRIPKLPMDLF